MKISITKLLQCLGIALICSVAVAACGLFPDSEPGVSPGQPPVNPGNPGNQGYPGNQGSPGGERDWEAQDQKRRDQEKNRGGMDQGQPRGNNPGQQGGEMNRGQHEGGHGQEKGNDPGNQGGEKDRGHQGGNPGGGGGK